MNKVNIAADLQHMESLARERHVANKAADTDKQEAIPHVFREATFSVVHNDNDRSRDLERSLRHYINNVVSQKIYPMTEREMLNKTSTSHANRLIIGPTKSAKTLAVISAANLLFENVRNGKQPIHCPEAVRYADFLLFYSLIRLVHRTDKDEHQEYALEKHYLYSQNKKLVDEPRGFSDKTLLNWENRIKEFVKPPLLIVDDYGMSLGHDEADPMVVTAMLQALKMRMTHYGLPTLFVSREKPEDSRWLQQLFEVGLLDKSALSDRNPRVEERQILDLYSYDEQGNYPTGGKDMENFLSALFH